MDDELKLKIGKRLKECLNDKYLSQNEFADEIGYTPQYISRIINGKKVLSKDAAKKFSEVLNVSVDYLFCKTDFKTENDFRIANDNLWDAKDETLLTLLVLYGYNVTLNFSVPHVPGIEPEEKYSIPLLLSSDSSFSGSFNKPCNWEIMVNGKTITASIVSVTIAYNSESICISTGKFKSFLLCFENCIRNFMDNALLFNSELSSANACDYSIKDSLHLDPRNAQELEKLIRDSGLEASVYYGPPLK